MKKIITLLILNTLLIFSTFCQTKVETLNNATIIKLTKAKIQDAVIIQKINKSVCAFDVSPDALIILKDNNVGEKVVDLMISKQDGIDDNENQNTNNSTDKNYVFKESGIYFLEDKKHIMLDPTSVGASNLKRGGCFLISTSYKYKTQLEGNEANYQLKEKKPTFYFNFEPVKKSLNNSTQGSIASGNYMTDLLNTMYATNGNSNAISPNDFKLIRLDKSRGKREYVSGKIGALNGADMSIGDSYIITFKYEKVSRHTYKIILPNNLKPGEYCFIYGNKINVYGQSGAKAFDFGVKK